MLTSAERLPVPAALRYEVEQSRLEVPPLLEVEPGHWVACFNPVPEGAWAEQRAAVVA